MAEKAHLGSPLHKTGYARRLENGSHYGFTRSSVSRKRATAITLCSAAAPIDGPRAIEGGAAEPDSLDPEGLGKTFAKLDI